MHDDERAEMLPPLTARSGQAGFKVALHAKLMHEMNLLDLASLDRRLAREKLTQMLHDLVDRESPALHTHERDRVIADVLDEIFGLGPIEPLMTDRSISQILINGSDQVYVERDGLLERTDVTFYDDGHLLRIIDRIVASAGYRVDESSPLLDARLADGTRVTVILQPLSLTGSVVSIRRYPAQRLDATDLVRDGALTTEMLELLEAAVRSRRNILLSGGIGTGKSTLLNVLCSFIPESERIVTIEQFAELNLVQPHLVRLETRPANIEGHGAVDQRQLFVHAVRIRPGRIVIGELQGREVFELLQEMSSGLNGVLTSLTASSSQHAISRLETMISLAEPTAHEKVIRRQLASSIHVVVQLSRLHDGSRRVVSISEIAGLDGTAIDARELFVFEPAGTATDGRIRGVFRRTAEAPSWRG